MDYTAAFVWLVAIVVLVIVESQSYNLISVWFAGGAVAAMITALLDLHIGVQLTVFVLVSGLLLCLMRPFAKKMLAGKKTPTNADRVIGQVGLVLKQINPVTGEGQVKVIGQIWSARPEDGVSLIPQSRYVDVVGITGVKVVVRERV